MEDGGEGAGNPTRAVKSVHLRNVDHDTVFSLILALQRRKMYIKCAKCIKLILHKRGHSQSLADFVPVVVDDDDYAFGNIGLWYN